MHKDEDQSRRYAVVIGSSEYDDEGLAALKKPRGDVAGLVRVLRDPTIGHFDEVLPMIDEPVETMRREIARLFAHKSRHDLVLLYVSGHGLKDENGSLYLAAKDTERDLLRATAVPASYVSHEMNCSRSRRQVLILDCCYSGAFEGLVKDDGAVGTASAFAGNGFGRVVLTATDSIEHSWEEDDAVGATEASVFTHFLVQGLETGDADADADGSIGLGELYDYVYQRVVTISPRQTPGKWSYKQQGEIVIARNPRRVRKTLPPRQADDAAPVRWTQGSPYRGLQVFDFEHAPIFFGRSKAVAEILTALQEQALEGRAFVLVLGMSGGGKSSVVRAGVLPQLVRPGFVDGVDVWRRAVMRPGDAVDLFEGLTSALLREEALPELTAGDVESQELTRMLRESPQAAMLLLKDALSQATDDGKEGATLAGHRQARLALLVDQAEEMFTLAEGTHEDRERFVALLDVLARSGIVWVAATLRSDFYARCSELETLVALKSGRGQYDLLPPSPAEIGQMIRQPARAAGLSFEEDPESNQPLSEVLRDAGLSNPAGLPLMEFTLERLYEHRTGSDVLTYAAYRHLQGVTGSLAQHADSVLDALAPEVREALPRVLRSLARLSVEAGSTLSRQRALLASFDGEPQSRALVDVFVEARLFVVESSDDDQPVVSVAHEALLDNWPRAQQWLQEDLEYLRIRERVTREADQWQSEAKSADYLLRSGKPLLEAEELLAHRGEELPQAQRAFLRASLAKGQRLRRLKQVTVAALVVLTVIASWAAYVARQESREAETQRQLADSERENAEFQAERAEERAESASQISDFLVGLFDESDPNRSQGQEVTVREMLDRGAEQIEQLSGQPEIKARQEYIIGITYRKIGNYEQAKLFLDSSLEIRKNLLGNNDLSTAESMRELAYLLRETGDHKESERLFRQVLEIRESLLGDQDADLAESIIDLGTVLYEIGEVENAEKLYRQSLAINQSLYGENHASVAANLDTLAVTLMAKAEYDEAEILLREALRMRRDLLGEHLDVAWGLYNLASLLYRQSRYEEAEEAHRESLGIRRKLLGRDHSLVADSLGSLGLVLADNGQVEKAKEFYKEAIETYEKTVGSEHIDLGYVLFNYAWLQTVEGNYREAERLLRAALNIFQKIYGEEHLLTASVLGSLGRVFYMNKNYDAAKEPLHDAVKIRRELQGESHPEYAVSLKELALWCLVTGDPGRADLLLRESIQILSKSFPEGSWRIANAHSALGETLAALNHVKEAEEYLLNGYEELNRRRGESHLVTRKALTRIIDFYEAQGQTLQAEEFRKLMDN